MQRTPEMIVGVGIDMIAIRRVEDSLARTAGFRGKVFSADEIEYCERQTRKGEHYAARFAAKEAFLKATGLGLAAGLDLHHVEVRHDDGGRPFIALSGDFREQARQRSWNQIHLSISHTAESACAVVIIET